MGRHGRRAQTTFSFLIPRFGLSMPRFFRVVDRSRGAQPLSMSDRAKVAQREELAHQRFLTRLKRYIAAFCVPVACCSGAMTADGAAAVVAAVQATALVKDPRRTVAVVAAAVAGAFVRLAHARATLAVGGGLLEGTHCADDDSPAEVRKAQKDWRRAAQVARTSCGIIFAVSSERLVDLGELADSSVAAPLGATSCPEALAELTLASDL